jgi:hypothetical protein
MGNCWASVTPAEASKQVNAAKNPFRTRISSDGSNGVGEPRKSGNIKLPEWPPPGWSCVYNEYRPGALESAEKEFCAIRSNRKEQRLSGRDDKSCGPAGSKAERQAEVVALAARWRESTGGRPGLVTVFLENPCRPSPVAVPFLLLSRGLQMNSQDLIIASLPETQLTFGGLLKWLNTQGRLGPLVREALAARFVRDQARKADLSATAEELQAAADHWRRRHGLYSAADTQAWLLAQGLSVDDFEARLEQDLLAAKLRSHLTGAEVDGHFAAHQAGFERLRLVQVLVPREDLAREIASQVREEGRDLADVAREQGLQLVRVEGFRKELNGPLGSALGSAGSGQLVGPVATPRGFGLVLVEERRPAELDTATRQRIQDELFEGWLAARLREATLNLSLAEVS